MQRMRLPFVRGARVLRHKVKFNSQHPHSVFLFTLGSWSLGVPFFDRPSGTCRCPKSNFGVSYCLSAPSYLDGDGGKPYHGDRHPEIAGSGYDEDAFEPTERKCRTCGVLARCLKKEHLKDVVPGIEW